MEADLAGEGLSSPLQVGTAMGGEAGALPLFPMAVYLVKAWGFPDVTPPAAATRKQTFLSVPFPCTHLPSPSPVAPGPSAQGELPGPFPSPLALGCGQVPKF